MRTKEAAGKNKGKKNKRKKWIFAAALWLLAGISGISVFAVMKVLAAPEDPAVEALAETMIEEQKKQEEPNGTAWKEPEKKPETEAPVIIIDPGHGGVDDGCVTLSGLKLLGFYPTVSWTALGVFTGTCILYFLIGLWFIFHAYTRNEEGEKRIIPSMLKKGKAFIFIL